MTSFSNRLLTVAALAAVTALPAGAQDAPQPEGAAQPRPRQGRFMPEGAEHFFSRFVAPVAAETPKLGVMVSDDENGVLVEEITEGSLAESAGLQQGDLLFKLAGQRVDAVADIASILAEHTEAGGEVEIVVIREGQGLITLTGVRPAPQPEAHESEGHEADGHRGAFLGVHLGEAKDGLVEITEVIDGTAAWFAGMDAGDLLVSIDDQACAGAEGVASAVAGHAPGDLVELTWQRGGETHSTRVRLGHRQPESPLGMWLNAPGGGAFGVAPGARAWRQGLQGLQGLDPEAHDELLELFHGQAPGRRMLRVGPSGSLPSGALRIHPQVIDTGDGSHSVRIEIKDGRVRIERDGEVEEHALDEAQAGNWTIHQTLAPLLSAGGALALVPELHGFWTAAPGEECEVEIECESDEIECEDAEVECEEVEAPTTELHGVN